MYMKSLFILTLITISSLSFSNEENNGPESNPFKSNLHNWLSEQTLNVNSSQVNQEGIVYVAFTIDNNYQLNNVSVVQGVSDELDAAALTMVKNMPLADLIENPENAKGDYIVPIKFVIK